MLRDYNHAGVSLRYPPSWELSEEGQDERTACQHVLGGDTPSIVIGEVERRHAANSGVANRQAALRSGNYVKREMVNFYSNLGADSRATSQKSRYFASLCFCALHA